MKLIHKEKKGKANLFLIGGGMISAQGPGAVKKALLFAKETGLNDTFRKCDNGLRRGYNIDRPDVIAVRNALLPARAREQNMSIAAIARI